LQLADGDFVESWEPLPLGQTHVDEFGVHALDVGQHEQLLDGGVVAHVAFATEIGFAPLFSGLAEEGHVEHIGLAGIDHGGLGGGDGGGDDVGLNGVGVDAAVELGEGAVEVPPRGGGFHPL